MPPVNNSDQALDCIRQAQELLAKAVNLLDTNGETKSTARKSTESKQESLKVPADKRLDFSMPIRAFLKKHAPKLSGPKKLTLLAAYLAKGNEGNSVALTDIESNWSTTLMGVNYNAAFTSRARDNDWINTSGSGIYQLRPSWREILD